MSGKERCELSCQQAAHSSDTVILHSVLPPSSSCQDWCLPMCTNVLVLEYLDTACLPCCSDCDIMSKLRCLRPTAALALNVFPDTRMSLTTLLPAAHLVTDLHAKLQMLFNRARRPASFAAAAAPALPHGLAGHMGSTPGAQGVPFTAASRPHCLHSVTLQQLAKRVVSLLPALQRHLSTALTVIRQPPAEESEELFKGGYQPRSWLAAGCTLR